ARARRRRRPRAEGAAHGPEGAAADHRGRVPRLSGGDVSRGADRHRGRRDRRDRGVRRQRGVGRPRMEKEVVLYRVEDAVAIVTLNRPERLNAWTPEMERAYFDALD